MFKNKLLSLLPLFLLLLAISSPSLHSSKRLYELEDSNIVSSARFKQTSTHIVKSFPLAELPEDIVVETMKKNSCGWYLHPVSRFYRKLFLSQIIPTFGINLEILKHEDLTELRAYIQQAPSNITTEFLQHIVSLDIQFLLSVPTETFQFLGTHLPNVKKLDLYDKKEENKSEILSCIPENFSKLTSLYYVQPNVKEITSMVSALRKFTSLTSLSELSIWIPGIGEYSNPITSIAHLTTLESLTLIHDIPDTAFEPLSSLVNLNKLTIECNKEFVGDSFGYFTSLNKLTDISIYNCKYFEDSPKIVAELERITSLKSLTVENKTIHKTLTFRSMKLVNPPKLGAGKI